MNKDEYENILNAIDTSAKDIKYDFEISEAFRNALEANKDVLSETQTKQLEWELLLFRLTTKNNFATDGIKTDRFVPVAIYESGAIFPDPNAFPIEALIYFEQRSASARNPILKARYLDFLWEKSKSKSKHLFALEAIEQYILTLDAYEMEETIIERLDGIQRATELARILESKKSERPLSQKIVAKLNELIKSFESNKNYRWLLELFELVLVLSSFYSKQEVQHFVRLCEEASNHYQENQNFHLQRSFLSIKLKLIELIDSSGKPKNMVNEEIGKSWIGEADAKSGSGLVRVHFLQEAINHYKRLGDLKKVEELIGQVKSATKQAVDNSEFQQFSTTIELKKADWEAMKNSLGLGEDVPENMGTIPTFFPDWNQAIKMTEEHSKKFVFSHIVAPVTYSDKYPISVPRTPEQEQEDRIMGNYKIQVELAHHWLTGCISELIKVKKLSITDFKKFLSKLETIDKDTYDSVWIGLESYYSGDHYNAIHVLTTQLEDLLRQLLNLFGGQSTTQHIQANAFTEKNLNRILIELKPYFPERLFRYISYVLDDYRGYNLRYKVGHGFLKKKHALPTYSTALLHIYCLLIANTKISAKRE